MTQAPASTPPKPRAVVTMRRALTDPNLLGLVLAGGSWRAWRIILIATMGEPLDDDERAIFTMLTGRLREPLQRCDELWGIVGRRGGKSRAIAVLIVYVASFVDHSTVLVAGEKPVVLCLAPSQKQASIVLGYVGAIFDSVPLLAKLIVTRNADTLILSNRVEIEIRAASFRSVRGTTSVLVIADEAAFYFSEDSGSTNPDSAIINALRPSLATTNGLLVVISSPYARRGAVFEAWARDYGANGDPRILVAQGASRDFNPSLPQAVVDRAMARDPQAASAEYLGLFRSDLEAFVSRDLIQSAVDIGVLVRPPRDTLRYVGFVDAASGVGKDSFAVCIAHLAGVEVVVDLIHEIRPPFNPTQATAEVCALLKSYRINSVRGDKYSAGFVIEAHAKCGVTYAYSDNDTSANYLESLPLFASGRVRLVDNSRVVSQFAGLERRTGSGRDRVDHGSGDRHDDASAATAGALALAVAAGAPMIIAASTLLAAARAPARNRHGLRF